mgnify:CR=1 FL=1
MPINTNITLTEKEKTIYQRFVNLSVNETPLPQGDATIRISPFDDYFLFTIFDEIEGEDTPIDLSNVGDIFINFIGQSDEIDIKNYTQVEEIDLAQGQVLFRITRSDSKKIIALDNNNFYISTKMISQEDGSVSDESILYQGIWLAAADANRTSLTSQIEDQRIQYSIELAEKDEEIRIRKKNRDEFEERLDEAALALQAANENNIELANENALLREQLDAAENKQLLRKTQDTQALAERVLLRRQQEDAARESRRTASSGSRRRGFFAGAARNLERFATGASGYAARKRRERR